VWRSACQPIYNSLRSKNPGRDEHWILANTWLERYGNWEASKKKGSELTRFIAYKDTFQFSLLDSPKSIQSLTLYLIYKELGDKEAEGNEKEFGELTEEIRQAQDNGTLLEVYKKKNPFTWSEIEREGNESIYGLYGFLKATDHLNKNPDERERIMEELKRLDNEER